MPAGNQVRVPSRSQVYTHLLTAGLTCLAVGLAVPFLVGEPLGAGPAPVTTLEGAGSAGGGALASEAPERTGGVASAAASPALDGLAGDAPALAGPTETGGRPGPSTAGGPPGGGASESQGGGPAAPLTASDVGVTPESIEVGILIPELNLEGVELEDAVGNPQEQWDVSIRLLNEAGGINGRIVEPIYRGFDILDADSMRAACVYLTEDVKVFAVMNAGGYYGDPILCITEQHQTPFIGQAGEIEDFYIRSQGLYFSTTPVKERVLRNMVARMHENGELASKTIGLLDREGLDKIPVDRALIPLLERLGYRIAHRATISNDFSVAQSQMPIAVQNMRSAGVDLVLPVTGLDHATLFASAADSQRYYPAYFLSDFASGTTDIYTVGMPDSFDGAMGYTALRTGEARAGLPEAPHDQRCRERFEQGSGQQLDRTSTEYYSMVTACGILDTFAAAATRTGVTLTRPALSQALQGLGEFPVPYSGAGSFGPGKFDAPDVSRHVVWRSQCRCWLPTDGFVRTPY